MESSESSRGCANVATPDRDGSAVLRIEGLTVEFATEQHGSMRVVDDVTLELARGETLGLVGESGSGKTVTGLASMRLLPPTARVVAGRVELNGRNLFELTRAEMNEIRGRDLAMSFQEARRSLDPCYSIGEQIAEVIRAHQDVSRREAFDSAVEMLERVQIPHAKQRARDYPHEFSGGQCQRVMLAVALACRPQVLIADEPTTGLDVTVQAAILDLLCELQSQMDLALLLITHDLGVIADLCNRVAVMYAGQLVEHATTLDLFESPQHPYSRGLLRSMPQVNDSNSELWAIPGVVPAPHEWPTGCRFSPRCDFANDRCRAEIPAVTRLDLGKRSARCLRLGEFETRLGIGERKGE